ncbi:hypothetical protein HQ576_17710, partial [bacterium]|nr:hypothetical protein [bacterium]
MRRLLPVLVIALVVGGSVVAGGAKAPAYYVKKSTWHDTLIASREALVRIEAEAARQKKPETDGAVPGLALGDWHVIGPFKAKKKGFEDVFPPEREIDLKKKYRKFTWQRQPKLKDGYPHRLRGSYCTHYLTRTITADAAKSLPVYMGADDCITVWLNGQQVYTRSRLSGLVPNADKMTLKLAKGENRLLLKVWNAGGDYGFYFHTSPRVKGGDPRHDPRRAARDQLWERVGREFPDLASQAEMAWEARDGLWRSDWKAGDLRSLAQRYAKATRIASLASQAQPLLAAVNAPADLQKVRTLYHNSKRMEDALAQVGKVDLVALRLAIADLAATYPDRYTKGSHYLARLQQIEKTLAAARSKGSSTTPEQLAAIAGELLSLRREALLANPLLDFDRLLVLKRDFGPSARRAMSRELGMPSLNSHNHNSISNPANGWDNEIAVLSGFRKGGTLATLFKPEGRRMVCDVDLHWDADRLTFSMPGTHDRWHVFELDANGQRLRQLTPKDLPDIDHFDPCYLPNGNIVFCSTAGYHALPCENGSRPVAPLYVMKPDGSSIRQITFEQDTDFTPSVKNDGRILYLRWEYSDTPHYYSRILFHCNPDGTAQMEYYGSGSYFPNAYNFARAIPGHPTQVVGIVGGHHGISRSGRLVILDPALGRHEADGVVQEIPGRGKVVEPLIRDALVNGVWPQFLHPFPLSEKYFLVSAKLDSNSLWGIYLVDVFDNMLLVKEVEGSALLEPVPLRKVEKPPAIIDKVDLRRKDAVVYLMDIYKGDGLKGIPRGSVKALRLFAYHFGYWRTGGHASVGVESSWDIKRVLGTVPVEPDGSAYFRIPANTPISLQPLDERGRALQLMRTWLVGMPGETVGCVGCHERQSTIPHNANLAATRRPASDIQPWRGPARPFAYVTEVQPVLDKFCVGCHDGKPRNGKTLPNFADPRSARAFNNSYMALQPYVRRPGPESDIHMFRPMEYHASTSELIQRLEKGHHGVKLDAEAWDRLHTWIDLNAPFVGYWQPKPFCNFDQRKRRIELATRYANVTTDPQGEYEAAAARLQKRGPITPIVPKTAPRKPAAVPKVAGWPMAAAEAAKQQAAAGPNVERTLDLGNGVAMKLRLIPAGTFVMG